MKYTRKSVRTLAATLLTIGSLVGGANAALTLNISDNGGGQTRWQFAGSTTIAAGVTQNTTIRNGFWFDEINLAGFDSSAAAGAVFPVSGSWSGTSTPVGALSLQDVYLDSTRFGIRVDNGPSFGVGDTISWSGDFVLNVAITNFAAGSFSGDVIGTDGDFQRLSENTTVTVGPIPEPSSVMLLGLGALGVMARRRRIN